MVRIVKKPEERKAEIVRAARRLFKIKDYETTTMQDIMEALGIAKGTIYHYFISKEALLEAVIEHIVDEMIEQMQAIIDGAPGNALEKMQCLMRAGATVEDTSELLDYLHKPSQSAMHSRLLAVVILRQAPLYAALIKQGCDEGFFKTDVPLECAELILSGIQFLTDTGIYPWTLEDLARRMHAFPRLVEQQLQAAPGSFQFLINLSAQK